MKNKDMTTKKILGWFVGGIALGAVVAFFATAEHYGQIDLFDSHASEGDLAIGTKSVGQTSNPQPSERGAPQDTHTTGDLVISRVIFNTPAAGKVLTGRVFVRNNRLFPVFFKGTPPIITGLFKEQPVKSIQIYVTDTLAPTNTTIEFAANEEKSFAISSTGAIVAGTYSGTLQVDPSNNALETNDANNSYSTSFSVAPAVDAIRFGRPTLLKSGESKPLEDGLFAVTFDSVTKDNRCPPPGPNTDCAPLSYYSSGYPREAIVHLKITGIVVNNCPPGPNSECAQPAQPEPSFIDLHIPSGSTPVTFDSYQFVLNSLKPAIHPSDPSTYQATITVTKTN